MADDAKKETEVDIYRDTPVRWLLWLISDNNLVS